VSLLTSFRDAPIKRKLMLISLLTSSLALLYITLILAASGWVDRRADAVSDWMTYARVIGANATTAMLFDDADAATKTLAALAASPDIADAVIYDKAGKIFARYLAPQHDPGAFHSPVESGAHLFSTTRLLLSETIEFKGKALGSIYLEVDLLDMYADILRDAGLVFLIALSAFLASLFLLAKLQKTIVEPLAELSNGMGKVSAEQDYALRVEVHGKDEVGRLASAFNDMLGRIQQRDTELAQHREHLEEEVAQRTASLQESENRFRRLFENANDAIFIHTSTGEILDANPQAENMMGYSLAVLKTMPIPALHPPEELEASKKAFEETISKGSARFESRFRHSGGTLIDVEISARIVDSEKGIIQGVARDITERKLAEQKLKNAYQELENIQDASLNIMADLDSEVEERKRVEASVRRLNDELEQKVMARTAALEQAKLEVEQASRGKDEFLAAISHELKTPLNHILGFADLLKEGLVGELSAEQKGMAQDIFDAGSKQLAIVNSLIELARLQAGKVKLQARPEDPAKMLGEIANRHAAKAQAAGLAFAVEVAQSLGEMPLDREVVTHLLDQLLKNACKFTPSGGKVSLVARRVPRTDVAAPVRVEAGEYLELAVADNGPGVAPEILPRLFQPFVQGEGGLARSHQGTGVGLTLVKLLAELHGGGSAVESKPGSGAKFLVWLPCGASQPGGESVPPSPNII